MNTNYLGAVRKSGAGLGLAVALALSSSPAEAGVRGPLTTVARELSSQALRVCGIHPSEPQLPQARECASRVWNRVKAPATAAATWAGCRLHIVCSSDQPASPPAANPTHN